jgi:hypothetical protein
MTIKGGVMTTKQGLVDGCITHGGVRRDAELFAGIACKTWSEVF